MASPTGKVPTVEEEEDPEAEDNNNDEDEMDDDDNDNDDGQDSDDDDDDDDEENDDEDDDDDDDDDEEENEEGDEEEEDDNEDGSSSEEEGEDETAGAATATSDNPGGISEYERLRNERIRRNKERLQELGLLDEHGQSTAKKKKLKPQAKKRPPSKPLAPSRRSSRASIGEKKSYAEPSIRDYTKLAFGDAPPSKKEKKPKVPKPPKEKKERKPSKIDLRPTREIYDEFQAVRRMKKMALKTANRLLRQAEKEVAYWQKKSLKQSKQQNKVGKKQQRKAALAKLDASEQAVLGGLTAKEFLQTQLTHEVRQDLKAKMAEFDQQHQTPQQLVERQALDLEHQHKLLLLEAQATIPKTLRQMARTLGSCLLERAPKDNRPPPRRSKRKYEDEGVAVADTDPTTQTNKKGRKRKKTEPSSPSAAAVSSMNQAAAHASLAENLFHTTKDDDTTTTTTAKPVAKRKREKRDLDVGGWVSANFATRIDRSWLESDAPWALANSSLKVYVPQPGDTVLYYPAGHYEFLQAHGGDHLQKNRITRMPLWERARKEHVKMSNANKAANGGNDGKEDETMTNTNNWWTDEWMAQAAAGKDRLPILCRVEKAQAEFPPDNSVAQAAAASLAAKASAGKKGRKTKAEKAAEAQDTAAKGGKAGKARKRPVLRLAVTLRPLTPLAAPVWTKDGPVADGSGVDTSLPPTFTCVTFPSPAAPYLVPFSWAYVRNHTLVVGEEVGHSPAKASVTGKPLHQKGKLLSLATPGDDNEDVATNDFRLDSKLDAVAAVLQALKKKEDVSVDDTKGKGQPSSTYDGIPPQDAFLIGNFLEGFLRKHGVPAAVANNNSDDTGGKQKIDMMALVRASFPIWKAAVVQRGKEDRTILELQPWDVKAKDDLISGPGGAESMKDLMEFGLCRTLDSILRVKIECSLEDYLQARPETFPFQELISEEHAPLYGAAVPISMSFRRILARLKQRGKKPEADSPCLYRSFDSFLADVQSIEDNCRLYNSPDSALAITAMKVTTDAKKHISGIVTSHFRELKDKLKEENTKKQFLAALVEGNDESLEQASETQKIKNVDPFKEPWKAPLFRDWIQLSSAGLPCQQDTKQARSNFLWVPQVGDDILYSQSLHAKFLEGHLDSLCANQCIPLGTIVAGGDQASPTPSQAMPNEDETWLEGSILGVRAEFPRIRKASEKGTFVTDAPVLALRVQLSDTGAGDQQKASVVYWRPCMFACDFAEDSDPAAMCCKTCGISTSTSFLRPTWADHYGVPENGFEAPQGLSQDENERLKKNLSFLKRRCLQQVVPDKFDANLTTEQIKTGYVPPLVRVGHSALPGFDALLTVTDTEASTSVSTRGVKKPEVDAVALKALSGAGFLPPWLPRFYEDIIAKKSKKTSGAPLHETVSPWPNLCLELVLMRISNGYYRQIDAVQNDLIEAFLNTQLLTWFPATRKKPDPISMKRLASALSAKKYAVTTVDIPFPSIEQLVSASQKGPEQALAPIKVRILVGDSTAGPKNGNKKAPGKKRMGEVTNASDFSEVLVADVPLSVKRSLGKGEATWVQCDKCRKWRRLFSDQKKLPSRWYCAMNNTDPERAKCAAPEEEFDEYTHDESAADNGTDKAALNEEEDQYLAHAEIVRRLYSAALAGISEPSLFSAAHGLKSLHVNREVLLSEIAPRTKTKSDRQAEEARQQLELLLNALSQDPCNNIAAGKSREGVLTIKPKLHGKLVTTEKLVKKVIKTKDEPYKSETPSESTPVEIQTTLVTLNGIKIERRHFDNSDELARSFFGKPNRNFPCARCLASRRGLFTCRVLKAHSNEDYDLVEAFKSSGGLNHMLCAMQKLAEPQAVISALKRSPEILSGENTSTKVNALKSSENGDDEEIPEDPEKAEDAEKADSIEMLVRSQAALEKAKKILDLAEAYAESPDRLSDETIATTFPFDERDNSYVYCIICGVSGDLLVCDNTKCPNVMHPTCGCLTEVPEGDWFCGQCVPIPASGGDTEDHPHGETGDEDAATDTQVEKGQESEVTERSPTKKPNASIKTPRGGQRIEEEDNLSEKENRKKPAAVTSHLPPIITFDDDKASELSSELNNLFFTRTGRKRGEDESGKEKRRKKEGEADVGTLFRKYFWRYGYFTGEIIALPTKDQPFYKARFEDGDEEEIGEEDMKELLEKSKTKKLVFQSNKDTPRKEKRKTEETRRGRRAPVAVKRESKKDAGKENAGRDNRAKKRSGPPGEQRTAAPKKAKPRPHDPGGDPILQLPDGMQVFLKTQKITTARDFMAAKSSDIAETYGKWRVKNKLPVLRGSGNVATISGEKAKIRQILENRGEEPLPEMKRGGMIYPGRQPAPQPRQNGRAAARGRAAPTTVSEAQPLPETKRAGNKRAIRRPDFFASP